MPRKIEISHRTIIFTVLFLMLLGFLYFIRDIIFQFFVALLIMAILNPFVTKLSKYKIPRAVSILVAYILTIGIVGVALAGVVPPLVDQTTSFVSGLPRYIENSGLSVIVAEQIENQLLTQLGNLPAQAAKTTISIFSNLLNIILVLAFAFYLLLLRGKQDTQLTAFFGKARSKRVAIIIETLELKLGGWARGQLMLMFLVGVSTYVGLGLLGIPFALPLAILAGLLEIVPYVGPIFAAIPAVIIGFGISPIIGFATTALVFLIQQLENYLLVPKVMEKSVGVSPIITLLSLTVGFKIASVVGAVVSIPVVISLQVFAKEFLRSR